MPVRRRSLPISLQEAIDILRQVRGDYIYAMLFLPLGLGLQNFVHNGLEHLLKSPKEQITFLLFKLWVLGLLLFVYFIEVLTISLVLLIPRGSTGLAKRFLTAVCTLVFIIAITIMSSIHDLVLFQMTFVVSMMASFGQLFWVDVDLSFDQDDDLLVLLCITTLFIAVLLSL